MLFLQLRSELGAGCAVTITTKYKQKPASGPEAREQDLISQFISFPRQCLQQKPPCPAALTHQNELKEEQNKKTCVSAGQKNKLKETF